MMKTKRREDLMCEADQPSKRDCPIMCGALLVQANRQLKTEGGAETTKTFGGDEDIQTRRRGWEECGAYPA